MPLALIDRGKTVSKSHAVFEALGEGIRIQDLHSTNGVAITVDGVRTVLAAGGSGTAVVGAVVELGLFIIRVERAAGAR